MKFLIIVEKAGDNYSAYSPDAPGCFCTGSTADEAELGMVDAIHNYLDHIAEEGKDLPSPTTATAVFTHIEVPSHGTGHAA